MRALPLFAAALTCFAQPTPVPKGMDKEVALGTRLAEDFEHQTGRVRTETLESYVNEIGQQLVRHLHGPRYEYHFRLTHDTGGGSELHEPVWFAGGFIYVPVLLLRSARSEPEFAGMLAHAIAHISERHGMRMVERGRNVNTATVPLVFTGGWGTGIVPEGFLRYYRQYELDADRAGAQLMAEAGFNPEGLFSYIDRVQEDRWGMNPEQSPVPLRRIRVSNLRQIVAEFSGTPYSHPTGRFEAAQQEARRISTPPPSPPQPPPTLLRPPRR